MVSFQVLRCKGAPQCGEEAKWTSLDRRPLPVYSARAAMRLLFTGLFPFALYCGRWGDASKAPSRTKISHLDLLAATVLKVLKYLETVGTKAKVHFFSQGSSHDLVSFTDIIPRDALIKHIDNYSRGKLENGAQDTLDYLSFCDVLVSPAPASNFFVLGAHLCTHCIVIADVEHDGFKTVSGVTPLHHRLLSVNSFNQSDLDVAWRSLWNTFQNASMASHLADGYCTSVSRLATSNLTSLTVSCQQRQVER